MAKRFAKSNEALTRIPSLLDMQDEVFSSAEELQLCLRFLSRVLSTNGPISGKPIQNASYLIDKIQVEFLPQILHESILIDHANSRLVIQLPKIKGQGNAIAECRRHEHLLKYAAIAEELRMRALIQAYRALNKRARKRLLLLAKANSPKPKRG